MPAFVLRFQEAISETEIPPSLGTATHTLVRAENSDLDNALCLIPPLDLFAGTMTATKVAAEHGDRDPDVRRFRFFQRSENTGTRTSKMINAVHSDEL